MNILPVQYDESIDGFAPDIDMTKEIKYSKLDKPSNDNMITKEELIKFFDKLEHNPEDGKMYLNELSKKYSYYSLDDFNINELKEIYYIYKKIIYENRININNRSLLKETLERYSKKQFLQIMAGTSAKYPVAENESSGFYIYEIHSFDRKWELKSIRFDSGFD